MIQRGTQVVGVSPQISPEGFANVLRRAGIPEAIDGAYERIVRHRVDPLFALAIFEHESTFGKYGVCKDYATKSPGNTRTSRTGIGVVELVNVPVKGSYVKYATWADGWEDLAFRLADPQFVYQKEGRTTVEGILPRWAPISDGNNPDRYINAVVDAMNSWLEPTQETGGAGLQYRIAHIPADNPNRPGGNTKKRWITIHETSNYNNGANAEMHRRFTHNGGGSGNVSFHFVVDDIEAIELLPLYEIAWHAGDGGNGEGNNYSIGIETCVNPDGDWVKTLENLATLVAKLCVEQEIAFDHIVQHNYWSQKNCPLKLRQGGYAVLMDNISKKLRGAPVEEEQFTYFTETQHLLGGGFRRYWLENGGLLTYGFPISEEYTDSETNLTIQYFQRARFEWHQGSGTPYDVLLGLLGSEIVDLKGITAQYPEAFAPRAA